jgi:hypothetical protein
MAYQYNVRLHYRFIGYRPIEAMALVANAIWVYAQYGVKLELASCQSLELSEAGQRIVGPLVPLPTNPDFSTYPVYQYLNGLIGPVDGIPVVFLPQRLDHANGITLPVGNRVMILINNVEHTRWTLAHELGHALLNTADHDGGRGEQQDHVMHPTVDIKLPPLSVPIFTPNQVQTIYRSPFCVPG